ncbi:MAG: deoxyribodipyrimidine photolyase [bacterium]|nr:deoxyribodipyrimidine photolyase [bacterium]
MRPEGFVAPRNSPADPALAESPADALFNPVSPQPSHESPEFPTEYESVLQRIDALDPVAYGSTRNYIDGAVSYLSPYISRGVVSAKFVMERVLNRGSASGQFDLRQIEKFIQELAWRDYWQQVWLAKGEAIDEDLRRSQPGVIHHAMPTALVRAKTGIEAIDEGIRRLYASGYLHNHLRMYVAALACSIGGSHWRLPARWMYYHLLDGDWASNALSWQWVAGANSAKQYVANQENINKYCRTNQRATFLDIEYESFANLECPTVLRETSKATLETRLPQTPQPVLNPEFPTLIYDSYNLDPNWRAAEHANRILLLEPSHFARYPVSEKSLAFRLELARRIPDMQIFAGEFSELQTLIGSHSKQPVYYKTHPTNGHYTGVADEREWMFPVTGYYPSFFAYWKKCRKFL